MYQGLSVKEPSTNIMATTPNDVFELFKESGKLAQETLSIVTLNTQNCVIKKHLITVGLVSSSLAHPRELFRPAILDGATAIIVSHNHPSGNVTPSSEDIKVTKQFVESGKILGIQVMDHVIIGDDKFLSIREEGIVSF
jgi:DNA repair protein RadC